MSALPPRCTASVDGISKKNDRYTYTMAAPSDFLNAVALGDRISVDGVAAIISDLDDEYVSFEILLDDLRMTDLVDVEVGTHVTIQRITAASAVEKSSV